MVSQVIVQGMSIKPMMEKTMMLEIEGKSSI